MMTPYGTVILKLLAMKDTLDAFMGHYGVMHFGGSYMKYTALELNAYGILQEG